MCADLAADRKQAIKDFWCRDAHDMVQLWRALRGAIEVEAPGPSGLWNVRDPNTQTLLIEAHTVMSAVGAFWRELNDKRPVDLPGFQAVLGRHVPRVPEGAWAQGQQYSMQDLRSALDKADGKAPGPNHVEVRFIKALPAPVQWLSINSYRAIVRGAQPPMHCRDAHIWLSPKVPGSARLDDYRPIALGQMDMKLLTGLLSQRITEELTRHGVVSDWQQGALPGSNTGPPLLMAQRQRQRQRQDGDFPLQRKHRLRLAAVYHWCLNTLATSKVVQDVILAILGGVTQYVAPFIADDSDTARHLDHITVQFTNDRARYTFDASRDSLQDDRAWGLMRVPTRCQQAAVALIGTLVHHRSASVRAEVNRIFWDIDGSHGICSEVHYFVPEFATLAGGDWVHRVPRALAALGVVLYSPIACPTADHIQLQSPPGNVVTLRTAKVRHRDTCRLTVPH